MKYTYTARNPEGKLERGELEAASEHDLAEVLRTKGLVLTNTSTSVPSTKSKFKLSFTLGQRVSVVDKIFFTQNLQVMVKAGLPLASALKTIAEQTEGAAFKRVLQNVSEQVDRGVAMSDALTPYPKVFSELFINMIRAGEKSGKLDEVLIQLATQLRKSHALISKVRGALTYPIIVVVAMIGIGTGMMIFVIPQITGVFEEVHAELPLPTRILIGTSDFLVNNGLWVALGAILFSIIFIRLIHTKRGRELWHGFLLKLPIMSPILKKINLAKFARTFSSLLKTDIPIVQAFHITATTLGNALYRNAIEQAAEQVKKGMPVATIIKAYPKLFSPLITQMISVGEETGTLDTVLDELAIFYEDDVDRTMGSLATIIEPVLMLLLGAGVGTIAVSIMLPLYALSENI